MVNADYRWQYPIQKFQNSVEGDELRKALLNCLELLKNSHTANMDQKDKYYLEIIEWDPDNPITPNPPPGWQYDIASDTWKKGGE